ncbi:MAG: hypothetical protein NZ455_02825 [Bacteroidia bacterium]|nr:hypothetical protein [Bacteroidia bacterium]MDW8346764.1 hypothetical protein [Bacteroidia bacterium]
MLAHALRMPHASGILTFYLTFIHILALLCLILIIKYLQGKDFLSCLKYAHFILFCIDYQVCTRLKLEYMDFA